MDQFVILGSTAICLSGLFICAARAENTVSPAAVTAAPADYSALKAKSAAASPADQTRAKQLFATSFSLWQSGDFAAAEIGFKQGLDLDPANAPANYYYGDCLARRKDKAEAKAYLARAVALGDMTPEGLRAQAELQQLSVAPTKISDMTADEIKAAAIGDWSMTISCPWNSGKYDVNITKIEPSGKIIGPKSIGIFAPFRGGSLIGDHIELNYDDVGVDGQLVSSTRMEGKATGHDSACTWYAAKRS